MVKLPSGFCTFKILNSLIMKYLPILLTSLALLIVSHNVALLKAQEPVIFSSSSAKDPNTRITFSVAFDQDKNAIIELSSSKAMQDDKETIHVYNDVQSMGEGGEANEIEVELAKESTYWIIPFDNPVPVQVRGGTKIILNCTCQHGNQDEEVIAAGLVTNWVVQFNCQPNEGCNKFKTGIQQVDTTWDGPALVLKASSVTVK